MKLLEFIDKFKSADPLKLRLSLRQQDFEFDLNFAITQIECRKKYTIKFKDFIKNPEFLFPDQISAEQASHQAIAKFHSTLSDKDTIHVIDLTAGLGIDVMTSALAGKQITAVELNPFKAEILGKNTKSLGIDNIRVVSGEAIGFLENTSKTFDLIFVDPSRRNENLKRVFNLRDCSPDVIGNQELLLKKSNRVIIKASPLLDIIQTLRDFKDIKSVKAVGVKGECKEVLIELYKDFNKSDNRISIEAIDLDNEGNVISRFQKFLFSDNNFEDVEKRRLTNVPDIPFANEKDLSPGKYILEPSAMVMKVAPWKEICQQFQAKKFGNSAHLFISDSLPVKFPGRVTKLNKLIKKQDRKSLSGFPATAVSKNHPLSSEEIRKSLKLKEGDKNFIYASRIEGKPILLSSESIS